MLAGSRCWLAAGVGFVSAILVVQNGLHAQTVYDFGNPGAEEQHHIELINRARANPPQEGVRMAATTDPDVLNAYAYFGVDLSMMQSEFDAIAPAPPLAPNASLTTAARGHSQWMLENAVQTHYQTNPANSPHERMIAAGYVPSATGENVAAHTKGTWHGHAGFQVDWGTGGTGGMQDPRAHRVSIHSPMFREIGVGVVQGTNGEVGPELVTQDFGTPQSGAFFGTGVAYYDLNGNQFYEVGEGIAGLSVSVQGASHVCTTADGGGWAVPIPSTQATRTVAFSGLGMNHSVTMQVPASSNAKADLRLVYAPPRITSQATGPSAIARSFTFTAVPGATAYQWKRWLLQESSPENCEDTSGITTTTTGSYAVRSQTLFQQGASAFHLLNSTGDSQSIQLNRLYYGNDSPSMRFQSRVRQSTVSESFKVQVQEEGSGTWKDVDVQPGGSPQDAFSLRTVSLSALSGKLFRIRFLLHFDSGSFFPHVSDELGWFIDAISFSGMSVAGTQSSQLLGSTSGTFTPGTGRHLISISPVISGREFPASRQLFTTTDALLSGDARLASLSLSTGTLSPAFSPATISYNATVAHSVSSLALKPSAAHTAARIQVNGSPVASGTLSAMLPLIVGNNTIPIVVTAENGAITTYRVIVTRQAAPPPPRLAALRIKGVSLSPSFRSGTRFYKAIVGASVSSVRVLAKTKNPDTKMRINGIRLISGQLSKPVSLSNTGSTRVQITLLSPDGTRRLYRITVNRK